MKAVLATGTHFHAIELYRIIGVQVEIEALEKECGVHAVGGRDGASHGIVDRILKAKNPSGATDELYGAGDAINRIRIGGILELEGEAGSPCGGHRHLFRYAAVAYSICIGDSWNRIECSCELRAEFYGGVLAGYQGHGILCRSFFKGEHVPAGVDVVEIRGDAAVDELDAHHVFEGAAEGPAKGVCLVVGHEIAVAAIHGHSHGTLLTVFAGRVRE